MVLRAGLLDAGQCGNLPACQTRQAQTPQRRRGKPKRHSAGVHQFIISPVEEHSKKPDVTRDKIVELAGDLSRVELFARQKTPGWDVWGNEVTSDLTLT